MFKFRKVRTFRRLNREDGSVKYQKAKKYLQDITGPGVFVDKFNEYHDYDIPIKKKHVPHMTFGKVVIPIDEKKRGR